MHAVMILLIDTTQYLNVKHTQKNNHTLILELYIIFYPHIIFLSLLVKCFFLNNMNEIIMENMFRNKSVVLKNSLEFYNRRSHTFIYLLPTVALWQRF